jgi:hypothetical protein
MSLAEIGVLGLKASRSLRDCSETSELFEGNEGIVGMEFEEVMGSSWSCESIEKVDGGAGRGMGGGRSD